MLPKTEILSTLTRIKGLLAEYGVSRIGLFGSSLREDADRNSDIDILIDFQADKETYQNFISSCEIIEQELEGQKVDIVTVKGLSPYIGERILREVVFV